MVEERGSPGRKVRCCCEGIRREVGFLVIVLGVGIAVMVGLVAHNNQTEPQWTRGRRRGRIARLGSVDAIGFVTPQTVVLYAVSVVCY